MAEQLSGCRYAGPVSQGEIEGYSFRSLRGQRIIQVLWTDFESSAKYRNLDISAGRLTVVEKLGGEVEINDGGPGDLDGQNNGQIRIRIGPSPVYVEID